MKEIFSWLLIFLCFISVKWNDQIPKFKGKSPELLCLYRNICMWDMREIQIYFMISKIQSGYQTQQKSFKSLLELTSWRKREEEDVKKASKYYKLVLNIYNGSNISFSTYIIPNKGKVIGIPATFGLFIRNALNISLAQGL